MRRRRRYKEKVTNPHSENACGKPSIPLPKIVLVRLLMTENIELKKSPTKQKTEKEKEGKMKGDIEREGTQTRYLLLLQLP